MESSYTGEEIASFDIQKLRRKTLSLLSEVEKRPRFSREASVEQALQRRYNSARTLEDYCEKFPRLLKTVQDGGNVLEVGAGDGVALAELQSRYRINGTATNLFGGGASVAATAAYLPFTSASFDIVIAIQSVTWEPDQRRAIGEIRRMLRPGGKAYINLYKFSEITALWFGSVFWHDMQIEVYKRDFEFNERHLGENDLLRSEAVEDISTLSKAFFVELSGSL